MNYRDRQLIKKIITECCDILRYTNEIGKEGFLINDIYQKATAMSFLNIGEHSNALTRELWNKHKDIQWRKIVDLRNIVAHGYGELRMELIWNMAQKEIPDLIKQLKEVLEVET